MSWPFSFYYVAMLQTAWEQSLEQKIFWLDAGSSPRKPGSLLVVRLNIYLLVSVISNESINFLIVGESDGVVNMTITA